MTDASVRSLERAFNESGSIEDEAAWLRERVRVGDLSSEKLALAAHLGYPAAVTTETPLKDLTRLTEFAKTDLTGWEGALESLRLLIALVSGALSWPENHATIAEVATAVHAAECFLVSPSAETALAARESLEIDERSEVLLEGLSENDRDQAKVSDMAYRTARWATFAARMAHLIWKNRDDFLALHDVGWGSLNDSLHSVDPFLLDVDRHSPQLLEELVPWLLDAGDPVRDRVEAREAAGE
jgi:hypothetical protein